MLSNHLNFNLRYLPRGLHTAILLAFSLFASDSFSATNTLDVLVIYTQEAESYYEDADGFLAHVHANFTSANMAFEDSLVDLKLRPQEVRKISYSQTQDDMEADLEYITSSSEIAAIRNQVGADLVCFFRLDDNSDSSGLAWILKDTGGDNTRGYSVVSTFASLSGLIFQHEIGHNLGGAHDRENSDNGGLYPYSHGHRFTGSDSREYRTVMAYAPGSLINQFSNPNIEYENTPTGIASGEQSADNARSFNNVAAIVNGYRDHIHKQPIAVAGNDITVEDWNGDGFQNVVLDASSSEYEFGDVSWSWTWPGGGSSEEVTTASFPIGQTSVTLTLTDAESVSDQDTITVTVTPPTPVSKIAAGYETSFFLKESGLLLGAGKTHSGALGFRSFDPQSSPVSIFASGVKSVSGGPDFTLVVMTDGSLWVMGANHSGQLGTGGRDDAWEPVKLFENGVAEVSAGSDHSLILKTDGSVWAMGDNLRGKLGDGTQETRTSPVMIFDSGVTAIAAGSQHSLFLKSDGSLFGAGYGFGDNPYEGSDTPFEIEPSGVQSISASSHSLYVKTDGSLWSFGRNDEGQLGDGEFTERFDPYKVFDSGVRSAVTGFDFSFILKTNGSLWHTGRDIFNTESGGQVGSPVQILTGGVRQIAAGAAHAVIARQDGSVSTVGYNLHGQLANGNTESQPTLTEIIEGDPNYSNLPPVANAGPDLTFPESDGDGLVNVELDGSNSSDDWQIVSWEWTWPGGEASGEKPVVEFPIGVVEVTLTVEDSNGETDTDTTIITITPQSAIVDIDAGEYYSLILKEDGSLWGSGENGLGQLGLGRIQEFTTFTLIEPSGVVSMSTYDSHTLYQKDDGSIWGMGYNWRYALSPSDIQEFFEPILILDSEVETYAAGFRNTFFTKPDGSAWAMGFNYDGQLGTGGTEDQTVPVRVIESGVAKIVPGMSHTLFLMNDGSLRASGNHGFGGDDAHSFIPIEVVSSEVADAATGGENSIVLFEDGSVWGVGDIQGFLHLSDRSELFEIVSEGAIKIESGPSFPFILMADGSLIGNTWVNLPTSSVAAATSGVQHQLYLRDDGSLWGSGDNRSGALGLGYEGRFDFATLIFDGEGSAFDDPPMAIAGADIQISDINGDGKQVVILDASDSYDDWQIVSWEWAWVGGRAEGDLTYADLDEGTTTISLTVKDAFGNASTDSINVSISQQEEVMAISSGESHVLMLTESGAVFAVGESGFRGTEFLRHWNKKEQMQLPICILDSGAKSISAGSNHSLILKEDGSLWAFGANYYGQLGDGTITSRTELTMVFPSGVSSISTGYWHSFAIKEDGSLWGFGNNEFGQLGVSSLEIQPNPIRVLPSGVTSVNAGRDRSLIVVDDGSVLSLGIRGLAFGEEGSYDPSKFFLLEERDAILADGDGIQPIVHFTDGSIKAYNGFAPDGFFINGIQGDVLSLHIDNLSTYLQLKDGSLLKARGYFGDTAPEEEIATFQSWIGSTIRDFSYSPGIPIILRTDGSVWAELYGEGAPAEKFVEGIRALPNTPPQADAGTTIVAIDDDNSGYGNVILDGRNSSDDWQIRNWLWEWPGNTNGGTSTLYARFPRGETIVKLTVTDDEGLFSSDEVRVVVIEPDEFRAWLSLYYTLEEIDSMEPDANEADPDNDGIINKEEKRMGLNPRMAFDPFTQSSFYFTLKNDSLKLMVHPYGKGLIYNLLGSTNLINWEIHPYPKIEFEDRIEYRIPESKNQYYKVQIVDPLSP